MRVGRNSLRTGSVFVAFQTFEVLFGIGHTPGPFVLSN